MTNAATTLPEPRTVNGWITDENGWLPIASAPYGEVVLLWKPTTREQYVACQIESGLGGPGWCTPDGFEIFGATHWHLLPKPPVSS